MKRTRLLGLVLGSLCAVVSVGGQENIRLHFEAYKNRTQIASPTVTVQNAETGSLKLETATVSFTPRRIDAQKIAVDFELVAGEKAFKPRLVLLNRASGSVSWKLVSGSDSFEIRVSAVQ
jgi:hypothetical protein